MGVPQMDTTHLCVVRHRLQHSPQPSSLCPGARSIPYPKGALTPPKCRAAPSAPTPPGSSSSPAFHLVPSQGPLPAQPPPQPDALVHIRLFPNNIPGYPSSARRTAHHLCYALVFTRALASSSSSSSSSPPWLHSCHPFRLHSTVSPHDYRAAQPPQVSWQSQTWRQFPWKCPLPAQTWVYLPGRSIPRQHSTLPDLCLAIPRCSNAPQATNRPFTAFFPPSHGSPRTHLLPVLTSSTSPMALGPHRVPKPSPSPKPSMGRAASREKHTSVSMWGYKGKDLTLLGERDVMGIYQSWDEDEGKLRPQSPAL